MATTIRPATGRLGVLMPGLGAVATTFIAGSLAIRKGLAKPIGSLTQMGTIRLGKRTDNRVPKINDFVPLAQLDDLVFGGWDIFTDNAYEAARNAGVLEREQLDSIKDELSAITPMSAVFDRRYVKKLDGPNVKTEGTWWDKAQALKQDIETFKKANGCDRIVMVWCGSTEIYQEPGPEHQSIQAFEAALKANSPAISPSMVYAYAAISSRVPYANGAPQYSNEAPALVELARELRVPIAGKDFKTGQTLMKTILAPGLKARMLGLSGWFSTNILGNRDGEVLDDPESFKSKEVSKLGVLDHILQPKVYPDLYKDFYHKVRINYYPRAGTTRRDGTTWTSSDGSATPCRSRWTSCAATRSSRRPSSSISRSSWTSRTGPTCAASRSGCPSTSKRPSMRRSCIPSTTCSSSS